MTFLLSALFGAIQGITEFFPISSSGHLVALHGLFPNFVSADQVGFDVALHLGTLVALVLFFAGDLGRLISVAWRHLARQSRPDDRSDSRLVLALVLGTIPAAIIGGLFESQIDATFRSYTWVGLMLIVGGFGFLLIERLAVTTRDLTGLRLRDAVIVGCAQVLAFIPGISRSGSTIAAGRALGFSHAQAARFSFLLSIPIVFGAGVKKVFDLVDAGVAASDWSAMAVGFLAALIVGLLALKLLLKFFNTHTLRGFAYYRFALGLVLLVIVLVR